MAMQKMNVRFSDEVKREIQRLSDETGESFSDVAREAMEHGVFDMSEQIRLSDLLASYGDSHKQQDLLK